MDNLNNLLENITDIDRESMEYCRKMWDTIAIPLGSLGKLHDLIIKCSGIYGTNKIENFKKCVVVMCADNGIVEEGVTQSPSSVTGVVSENMTTDKATISIMSKKLGGDVLVIDVGMQSNHEKNPKILNKKVAYGTKNFLKEDAMTREECLKAMFVGIEIVRELKEKGYNLLATGEMGIGNTTTSSAIASVLLGKSAEEVTGRGAGLTTEGLNRKIEVIKQGIEQRSANSDDVLALLCKVGGFDIAAMCGMFIGGGVFKIPILIDGFISSIAALLAIKMNENLKNYMFATHISAEPAGRMTFEALDLPLLFEIGMRLGEGSGAVMSYPFFDTALEIYNKMCDFEVANFHKYEKLV